MPAISASAIAKLPGGFATVEIDGGVKYNVHRSLLIEDSEYFKRALNVRWSEADDGVIRLGDVESGVFDVFVDWLYSKTINLKGSAPVDVALIDAIVLGDYLLAPAFTNAVKACVLDNYRSVRGFSVMDCAYEKLPEDHSIYRWIRNVHVTYQSRDSRVDGATG